MKKLLLFFVCMLTMSMTKAQSNDNFAPFGIPAGLKIPADSMQAILFLNEHGMNGFNYGTFALLTTVPKPIPQATLYFVIHTAKTGVCQVQAVIDDKDEIKTLQDVLAKKYGEPKFIDLKINGGFVSRVWISNTHKLPTNIMTIEISPQESIHGVIPLLIYNFNNFIECQKALKENMDDAL